jgi:hypothetical protein
MKTLVLLLAAALLSSGPAAAANGDRVADIGPFQFEQGGRIKAMRVGYSLHGHLDAARDNAILLLPPTSGTRHSYDVLIGPGKPFDTDQFMVITVDLGGGRLSSRPSDDLGERFPRYTIRDMVADRVASCPRRPQAQAPSCGRGGVHGFVPGAGMGDPLSQFHRSARPRRAGRAK